MKTAHGKLRINSILTALFIPLFMFAQENNFPDIEKYFSKKEKATFWRAWEHQDEFYQKIFLYEMEPLSGIQISVIKDAKEYGIFLIKKNIAGYYSPSERRLVICKDEKYKNSSLKTMQHELSHAMLHFYSGSLFFHIPPWLNEGLAKYLEGMIYGSKNYKHKKDQYLIARVKTLIELRDFDFADFVNLDQEKFYNKSLSQEGYGYAVGYCMVLFLLNKDEQAAFSLFRSLIEELKPTTEIFDEYYIGGFSKFEKDFIDYFYYFSK